MFERDKDELRSLGIPIEVGHLDAFFEDEVGYRIKRDAFELPQVELEPDEAAVVGLAARVWQHAGLADATSQALLKLKAAGLPVDREALDVVQPRLVADEPRSTPCGPRPSPARRSRSTTGAGGSASRPAGTCSRGVSSARAVAGTSWVTTPTAGSPGSSGSRESSATSPRTAGPAASSYRRARTCAG
jgi:hypothetical protein